MYCNSCGKKISEHSTRCEYCGAPIDYAQKESDEEILKPQKELSYTIPYKKVAPDMPILVLNVLAFFFPIIGIIVFLLERKTFPQRSKSLIKWTILGIIVQIIYQILKPYIYLLLINLLFGMVEPEINNNGDTPNVIRQVINLLKLYNF
ncbi:MAG: zinc-ribbon domain-containing protein [Clostridia bacterium]|nr:zinc-ribbon domain-containing protein [Clostridia bacterium]